MRRILKRAAEGLLARGGAAAVARSRARGCALVLAYHNIVPDGSAEFGDRSLHLDDSAFAAQLDELERHYEIVPLESVLTGPTGTRGLRVAITFDDASRGAVTLGVAELARRGLPATIFVAPEFVGGRTFWWDALTPPEAEGLPFALRAYALDELGGRDTVVRAWAAASGHPCWPVPSIAAVAGETELRDAIRHSGITLASHTWSHPNLARLSAADVEQELARSLDWLSERFGHAARPWLSYPYGLYSPSVEAAARSVGYTAAFAIEGGWIRGTRPTNPYAVPRLNIPSGVSAPGFALRVSGLLRT